MKKLLLAILTLVSIQAMAAKISIAVNNKYGNSLQVKINDGQWLKALTPWTSKTYKRSKFNSIKFRRVVTTITSDGGETEKTVDIEYTLPETKPTKFWVYNTTVSNTAPEEGEFYAL